MDYGFLHDLGVKVQREQEGPALEVYDWRLRNRSFSFSALGAADISSVRQANSSRGLSQWPLVLKLTYSTSSSLLLKAGPTPLLAPS
ncbi:hypothetical protein Baya_4279 [Bagarius yarrelli]|uniref:Uncharacterized protein n=1 Tax=Bagarius yarrelli TaxID=175774 RepID=A0A556TW24_BAGYA|nr:hypothetical protein Baya_4279 [Bagarius yarrelli]